MQNNSGILSRNTEKNEQHPNWPDYKGDITIDGNRYRVAGWIRMRKDGSGKYLSLAIQDKNWVKPKPTEAQAPAPTPAPVSTPEHEAPKESAPVYKVKVATTKAAPPSESEPMLPF